jgi:hypothetical protein
MYNLCQKNEIQYRKLKSGTDIMFKDAQVSL